MSDWSGGLLIVALIVIPFIAGFLIGAVPVPDVNVEEYSGTVSDFKIGELEAHVIFKDGRIATFRPDKNPSLGFSVGDNVWLRVVTISRRFGPDTKILEDYKILEAFA